MQGFIRIILWKTIQNLWKTCGKLFIIFHRVLYTLWKTWSILYTLRSSLHLVENYSCFIAFRHENSLCKPIRYILSVRLIIRYIFAVRAYLSLRLMIRCLYLTPLWVHYTTPHKVCYLNQPVLYYSWYSVSDINWCRPLSVINPRKSSLHDPP